MDWNLAITLILGSSFVASLVAGIFQILFEKAKNEEEIRRKLYAPFKFYLMLIDLNKNNRTEIIQHFKETISKWSKENGANTGQIIMQVMDKQIKVTDPL
jgi:type VI protein secretion system component VasK